jgi:hypothetical protein
VLKPELLRERRLDQLDEALVERYVICSCLQQNLRPTGKVDEKLCGNTSSQRTFLHSRATLASAKLVQMHLQS